MLCTKPEAYVGWRPFWICLKIGHLPSRDFWGFSTVDRKGTNELISGEKPLTAILSNLHIYVVVRLPDYVDATIRSFRKRYFGVSYRRRMLDILAWQAGIGDAFCLPQLFPNGGSLR